MVCEFLLLMNVHDPEVILKLGKKLRELRLQRELSQEDLANDAGIPINQVGRIERGEVNTTLSTLSALAKALNIKIIELVDLDN